jgi:hypothetical protein
MRNCSILVIFFVCNWSNAQSQPQTDSKEPAPVVIEEVKKKDELDDSKDAITRNKKANGSKPKIDLDEKRSQFKLNSNVSSKQRNQRSPSDNEQERMDEVVKYFEVNSPNSFEYHYFKYTAGNYDVSLYNHLMKAKEIRPGNIDVIQQLAAYYMIKNIPVSASGCVKELVNKLKLTSGVLIYSEDLLHSVPKNGTLITHGFDDTFGAWYQQNVKNVRVDVTIISIDFLQSDFYRKELKKKGYEMSNSKVIDVDFFSSFCNLNESKDLSVSLTMPQEYFQKEASSFYMTGLVMKYSSTEIDNFIVNKELWDNHLKKHLIQKATDEKSKQLSSNYLPMLLQMRRVYNQKADFVNVKELDESIDAISIQCNKYKKVQKLKTKY